MLYSQVGKRLMAKCRKLLQENEELGKVISSGNVAQLEVDLAYHRTLLNQASENEQSKGFSFPFGYFYSSSISFFRSEVKRFHY